MTLLTALAFVALGVVMTCAILYSSRGLLRRLGQHADCERCYGEGWDDGKAQGYRIASLSCCDPCIARIDALDRDRS